MGKARRTRQGIMIRFDENDAELVEWLGQFAQSQTMTKMVKLACYMMADLPIPAALQAAAPVAVQVALDYEPDPVPQAPRRDVYAQPGDTLAGVMQELAALREAVTGQQGGRAPFDDAIPAAEDPASSMMGDSRRRRRRHTVPARYEAAPAWDDTPPGDDDGSGEIAASTLDLSRPRRAQTRPLRAEPSRGATRSAFDAQSAQEQLLMSIRAFGSNRS